MKAFGVAPTDVKPDEMAIVGMRLYRWLARPVVAACVRLGISANAMTSLSLVAAAGSGVALLERRYVFATILVEAMVILDFVDGAVARRTGTTSYLGFLYDFLGDRVKLGWLLLCLGALQQDQLLKAFALSAWLLLVSADALAVAFVRPPRQDTLDAEHRPVGQAVSLFVSNLVRFDMHTVGLASLLVPFQGRGLTVTLLILLVSLALNFGRVLASRLSVDAATGRLRLVANRGVLRRAAARLRGMPDG